MRQFIQWNDVGCVPEDTLMLKLVEVRNWG